MNVQTSSFPGQEQFFPCNSCQTGQNGRVSFKYQKKGRESFFTPRIDNLQKSLICKIDATIIKPGISGTTAEQAEQAEQRRNTRNNGGMSMERSLL